MESNTAYEMWIRPLKLIKLEADRVIIAAELFKINVLKDRYSKLLKEAFLNIMGFDVDIDIIPFENIPEEKPQENKNKGFTSIENEKLTFNNFIVGPSNKFAYTASMRVAETPGSVFNPLFIYGKFGSWQNSSS